MIAVAIGAAALPAACRGANAAPYPSRQLTYLVAFDPGGQSDREARRQQPLLQQYLGRPVVIDYKVGGSGALGWSEIAHGRPDGYTFVGVNVPHIILQPLQQDTGYETAHLVPIVIFQRTPIALVVAPASPLRTLDDLIQAARDKPGSITIGGSGTLTSPHVATEQLNKISGVRTTYVPFSGSAPAITAFLGGHTVANFAFSDDLVRYREQMRILAIATEARFPVFPDVPTFRELGIDIVEAVDRGVAVARGVPAAAVTKLEEAFLRIANDPAIQQAQAKEGFVPVAMGSQAARQYIEERTAYYKQILRELEQN
jgi:tripartite-type tricarboxylate transporter receptor subunit TctC